MIEGMRFLLFPLLLVGSEVTEQSEKAVAKGKKWILRAQNRDGSWGLDAQTQGDVTCTVLACLALMADGSTSREGADPEIVAAVRRGVEWVVGRARVMRGNLAGGATTLIQNKLGHTVHTFFGTVFLTQIHGMHGIDRQTVEEFHDHLAVMAERIVKSQESDGSWHKDTFGSLKATCMAWLGLRAAASVGIDVEGAAVDKTLRFLKSQYDPNTKMFDRQTGHGSYQTIYATASCLRVLYAMGEGSSQEAQGATEAFLQFVRKGQMASAFLTVEGEDYLAALMMTQALLIEEGTSWTCRS